MFLGTALSPLPCYAFFGFRFSLALLMLFASVYIFRDELERIFRLLCSSLALLYLLHIHYYDTTHITNHIHTILPCN